jgi:hypothetical protein
MENRRGMHPFWKPVVGTSGIHLNILKNDDLRQSLLKKFKKILIKILCSNLTCYFLVEQFSQKSLNYKNHLHISSDNQLRWAMIFSVLYSVIIVVLTVAIAVGAGRCPMNLTLIFLLFLIGKVENVFL